MRIADIRVGDRRREDYGDIGGLAASIRRYGLLHPVVVDDEGNLVSGERRLRACLSLGWTEIEATNLGLLSAAEREEIELEENLKRKDLTSYERNKTLVRLAETAAQVDQQDVDNCAESARLGPREQPGSLRRVSERINVAVKTIHDAKSHVATADAYPSLQKPDWKQYHVLEAREHLERLPEPERAHAVAVIDQPGVPPQAALPILRNLAVMPAERRGEVFRLNESDDKRERSLALTMAADRPAMPDPRILPLRSMLRELRAMARSHPDDPATPAVILAADTVDLAIETIEGDDDAGAQNRA